MAFGKFEKATGVFAGQGDLGMFDKVPDYNTAKFANLANPKSFGQVVQDSSSFEGEDPEVNSILDEQGNTITATTTAGTVAFSFHIASTSLDAVEEFLQGVEIADLENSAFGSGTLSAVGFGVELPVQTRPVYWLNDERNKMWLYPKAKMTGSLTYEDGLWRISISATCEYLDTDDLKTVMLLETTGKFE